MKIFAMIDLAQDGLVNTKVLCSLMKLNIIDDVNMCESCQNRICSMSSKDTIFRAVKINVMSTENMFDYDRNNYNQVT